MLWPPASGVTDGHNLTGDDSCGLVPYRDDLVGVDALLAPLADNGGSTSTHALLEGSPAIDHVDNGFCPDTDQRGLDRPQDSACDIGAYEREIGDLPTPAPPPDRGWFEDLVVVGVVVDGSVPGHPPVTDRPVTVAVLAEPGRCDPAVLADEQGSFSIECPDARARRRSREGPG